MDNSVNTRLQAARVVAQLINHQGSLSSVLPSALKRVESRDRGLLQEICFGTARYSPKLEAILALLLRKPFHPNDADVHGLLLTALYQIDQMNTPDHAVVYDSTECAKELGKPWAAKLTNAVLRRYLRERESLIETLRDDPVFQFNHPDWFVAKLKHNWPDHWRSILEQNDQPPPMTLRVNARQNTREQYLDLLERAEITASPGAFSPDAIYLASPCNVDQLPGFSDGAVSVQDEAAQLAAFLLDCQPEDRVLDACAAPGGKLCHLLEHHPELQVDAVELEPGRATRITENLERIGLNANLILGDATTSDWWNGSAYDRILLDAPCSATGVVRRNPDIKLLRSNEDLTTLAKQQLQILTNLWSMLKPGGTLLYATCSIFPQENERIIERFLQQQPDAEHAPIDAPWGEDRPFGRQLFVQSNGPDGFYYARLIRTQEP